MRFRAEILNPHHVNSSIARRLDINIAGAILAARDVDGVVEMMLDATQHFDDPLTQKRLFGWQAVKLQGEASAKYARRIIQA